MHPGSLAGATHRARVQRRRVFARGWSRPIRVVAPRGARLPPSRTQIGRSDKTDVAAKQFHQKHAGCDSAPQELPSRTRFTRDCRDCNFGPKMSQNAMYRPYIAMIASPAISWRPRPILARPRMVPDTPRCALHAGGVSLTRLGRPEKSTFWWPRRVVRAAPRLVPQASFLMQTTLRGLLWSSSLPWPYSATTCGFTPDDVNNEPRRAHPIT